MTKILDRWLPSLTLGVWGGILFYFYASGRLAHFLHPSFRPGVVIASVVLLVMAAFLARGDGGDGEEAAAACCDEEACGHPLSRNTGGRFLTFGVLLLPLWLTFSVSPNGFSLNTIENRGVIVDADALGGNKRKIATGATGEGEVMKLSVIDLLYAAREPGLIADFEGKEVEIVGQTMAEKVNNPRGNRMRLVRMFMSCCAADAKPIAAIMEFSGFPETLPELSWVKVRGVPAFPMEGGKRIAVLKVESMRAVEAPKESILY